MTRKLHNVVIFGATSGIAQAVGRVLAERGCRLVLVARHAGKLAAVEADLRVRGAGVVDVLDADLADTGLHPRLIAFAWQQLGSVDAALIAHGSLGDQTARVPNDVKPARKVARELGHTLC